MSNDDTRFDIESLESDSTLDEPLARVSFEAGMLLGVEATRSEQDYHRRRLVRHHYWLHGHGTVVGLAVGTASDVEPGDETPTGSDDATLRIDVSPGIGIDGLGRDVLVYESHCVNLRQWLNAVGTAGLVDGYDDDHDVLWLTVTFRFRDCPSGLQPKMATELNQSTDPVAFSRVRDGVELELRPGRPAAGPPWRAQQLLTPGEAPAERLTPLESAHLGALPADQQAQLRRRATLMYAFADHPELLSAPDDADLAELASVPLAEIRIDAPSLDLASLVVNAATVSINNLVRPFVNGAAV